MYPGKNVAGIGTTAYIVQAGLPVTAVPKQDCSTRTIYCCSAAPTSEVDYYSLGTFFIKSITYFPFLYQKRRLFCCFHHTILFPRGLYIMSHMHQFVL